MNNLEIYELGRNVPPEAQKPFNNGKFSGTDINPMWRIKKLTEIFGPAGIGWYTDQVTERYEQHGDVTMAIVDLNLYVKHGGEWSKPIFGTGGNILLRKGSASDEGYKMAYTDALSVACKALGIGADVYYRQDVTKYTGEAEQQAERPIDPLEDVQATSFTCSNCKKKLEPYKDVNGNDIGIRQHVAGSLKKFGQPLCLDCIRKVYPDSLK